MKQNNYVLGIDFGTDSCRVLVVDANNGHEALKTYAVVDHPKFGKIYAYEIDGFGSSYLCDDANVPNLLSLPYLGAMNSDDVIYANTRKFVWSEYNPFFFKGKIAEGIGGPHIGTDMIWPMSIIMEMVFADKVRTEDWLASVYSSIPSPMWGYFKEEGYNIM